MRAKKSHPRLDRVRVCEVDLCAPASGKWFPDSKEDLHKMTDCLEQLVSPLISMLPFLPRAHSVPAPELNGASHEMTNEPSTAAPSKKQAGQGKEGRRAKAQSPFGGGGGGRQDRANGHTWSLLRRRVDRAPHRSITSLRNARQMPTARKMKTLPQTLLVRNAFHSFERSERKRQKSFG